MFWDKFEQKCKQKGISIYKALDDTGFSYGNIEKWKNGGGVTIKTMRKFSEYFKVPVSFWDEDKQESFIEDKQNLLEGLRSDQRVLFDALKNATPQEIKQAVAIIYALKEANGNS